MRIIKKSYGWKNLSCSILTWRKQSVITCSHLKKVIKVHIFIIRLLRINADNYSTKHLVIFWVLYIFLIIGISLLTLACKVFVIQYLLLLWTSQIETLWLTLRLMAVLMWMDLILLELLNVIPFLQQIQLQVYFWEKCQLIINFSLSTSLSSSKIKPKRFLVRLLLT